MAPKGSGSHCLQDLSSYASCPHRCYSSMASLFRECIKQAPTSGPLHCFSLESFSSRCPPDLCYSSLVHMSSPQRELLWLLHRGRPLIILLCSLAPHITSPIAGLLISLAHCDCPRTWQTQFSKHLCLMNGYIKMNLHFYPCHGHTEGSVGLQCDGVRERHLGGGINIVAYKLFMKSSVAA